MSLSQETCNRMRDSHADSNDSSTRYRVLCRHVMNGEPLCPKDYAFYRYYCKTHGIPTGVAHISKSASPLGFTKERPLQGKDRYLDILSRKADAQAITPADYAFLCRYCKSHGIAVPRLRAVYVWVDD